jgi:hypothetical protein
MKNIKRKKIIKWVDPEPKFCYPIQCGYDHHPKTGSPVIDLILVPTFVDAPRNRPADYIGHNLGCLWAEWAKREIARNM